jgi:TM2 domain-containing membrane protein YozV
VQTPQIFKQPAAQQPVYTQQPVAVREEKNAGVALILSFFFTGSGQVYNGEMGKGIGVLLGTIIGYMIFVIPGLLVFLYGLYDAYTTAQKMNKGEIPYKPTSMGAVIAFIVAEIVVALLFLFVVMAMIMGSSSPYYYY